MKTQQFSSLKLTVNLSVPESVAEFDANAKRAGACLEEAINNCVYRGSLADFRYAFLHGIEENKEAGIKAVKGLDVITGIERKTKPTGRKDKDGADIVVYAETEGDYFDRICAEKKVEPSSFQPVADEIAKLVVFDASARERKPAAPKKLAQKYKDTATAIMGGANFERFKKDVTKALSKNIVLTGDKDKDVEAVGWIVKEFAEYKEKQALASMV
jgi:hypothetical protein